VIFISFAEDYKNLNYFGESMYSFSKMQTLPLGKKNNNNNNRKKIIIIIVGIM
jgi:hypothetical protein